MLEEKARLYCLVKVNAGFDRNVFESIVAGLFW